MSRLSLFSKFIPLAFCLIVVMTAFGCSETQSPMSPSQLNPGDVILSPTFVRILPTAKDYPRILASDPTTKLISAEFGGTVSNDRVTLFFPPHALSQDTEITLVMDPSGLYISDLGPDGLVFNLPVTLTFNLIGTDAENNAGKTVIAWFNDTTGQWEMVENLPPLDSNTIQAFIRHFSKYGGVGG